MLVGLGGENGRRVAFPEALRPWELRHSSFRVVVRRGAGVTGGAGVKAGRVRILKQRFQRPTLSSLLLPLPLPLHLPLPQPSSQIPVKGYRSQKVICGTVIWPS